MVHGRNTHQKNSFIGAINSANAYSEAGYGVNERMGRKDRSLDGGWAGLAGGEGRWGITISLRSFSV
jgi:hypothetical protein